MVGVRHGEPSKSFVRVAQAEQGSEKRYGDSMPEL